MPVTIHAKSPDGFHVVLSVASMDDCGGMIKQLLRAGYEPWPSAAEGSAAAWPTAPDGQTPMCPKHRMPLRRREKQGDSWLSHAVQRGEQTLYCRGHPYGPHESDGFFVDLPTGTAPPA